MRRILSLNALKIPARSYQQYFKQGAQGSGGGASRFQRTQNSYRRDTRSGTGSWRNNEFGGAAPVATTPEAQLVGKLIELWPPTQQEIPLSKLAAGLPEDVQESLATYGGLASFARSQLTFFHLKKDSQGLVTIFLTDVAWGVRGQYFRKQEKNAEKETQRKMPFGSRGGFGSN